MIQYLRFFSLNSGNLKHLKRIGSILISGNILNTPPFNVSVMLGVSARPYFAAAPGPGPVAGQRRGAAAAGRAAAHLES